MYKTLITDEITLVSRLTTDEISGRVMFTIEIPSYVILQDLSDL